MSEEEEKPREEPAGNRAAEEIFKRTETRVRRIGYVIFFGLGAILVFPILIGAIQGIQQGKVWDPFTGMPVATTERVLDCPIEAADLIFLAGEYGELDRRWEKRFRRWVSRCQQDHLELYDLLSLTRNRLRGAEELPDIDDIERNGPADNL